MRHSRPKSSKLLHVGAHMHACMYTICAHVLYQHVADQQRPVDPSWWRFWEIGMAKFQQLLQLPAFKVSTVTRCCDAPRRIPSLVGSHSKARAAKAERPRIFVLAPIRHKLLTSCWSMMVYACLCRVYTVHTCSFLFMLCGRCWWPASLRVMHSELPSWVVDIPFLGFW